MGTPAKANIYARFETSEQADRYYKLIEDFGKNILKDLGKPVDTDICNEQINELSVEFELSSMRTQNLDWQCEWAIHYAKQVGGCQEFNADKWIMGDSFSFTEPEDIEDYSATLE